MYPARARASRGSGRKAMRRSRLTPSSVTPSRARTKTRVRKAARALPSSNGWRKQTSSEARAARAARAVRGEAARGSARSRPGRRRGGRGCRARCRSAPGRAWRRRAGCGRAAAAGCRGRAAASRAPALQVVRRESGRPHPVLRPERAGEPFCDVVDEHGVRAGPALEPPADGLVDQPQGGVGGDVPAAEEAAEHRTAAPVPAAATAGAARDVLDQVPAGALRVHLVPARSRGDEHVIHGARLPGWAVPVQPISGRMIAGIIESFVMEVPARRSHARARRERRSILCGVDALLPAIMPFPAPTAPYDAFVILAESVDSPSARDEPVRRRQSAPPVDPGHPMTWSSGRRAHDDRPSPAASHDTGARSPSPPGPDGPAGSCPAAWSPTSLHEEEVRT